MLLNLDGSRFVKDQVENFDLTRPMATTKNGSSFFVPYADDNLLLLNDEGSIINDSLDHTNSEKVNHNKDMDSKHIFIPESSISLSVQSIEPANTQTTPLLRHFAHVCSVNINETVLENAELCGTNLAVKLLQMGADNILEEINQNVTIIPTSS